MSCASSSHPADPPPALTFAGLGLFTGKPATLTIRPQPDGAGLRFLHCTFDHAHPCPALIEHVSADVGWSGLAPQVARQVIRNTALQPPATLAGVVGTPPPIATVEHVLAALAGLGVWHATLELEGPEVPILDGSALPFARALAAALAVWGSPAARAQARGAAPIVLRTPVRVEDGRGGVIEAVPLAHADEAPVYRYELDFGPSSPLPAHAATWTLDANAPRTFLSHVAPARTFSFEHEAKAAQALGLFRAFGPKDLPVIAPDGSLRENAWRMPHEPAHHKLLDLIGDLALLGAPLHAHVRAVRSGHALTHELCRRVRERP